MKGEEWRPVPGWEGYYEASNRGRIRSLDRIIPKQGGQYQKIEGKILKGWRSNKGDIVVSLRRKSKDKTLPIARLVLETFEGPLPDGVEIRHLNGNVRNNNLSNLGRVLPFQNSPNVDIEGANRKAKRTHCKRGHEFNATNTFYVKHNSETRRRCRACEFTRKRHEDIPPNSPEFKELADMNYVIFQEEIEHDQ